MSDKILIPIIENQKAVEESFREHQQPLDVMKETYEKKL